ncbi:hypothetical protein Pla8534_28240 [Lignipirellula cremea]|uniref:Uncharacterized protein n=1 Tax=Lignipirellula cremea TaxID=2528010 RepID=A0A518DT65_9BACT|nr:hypothetical protein Pla8534_28240 [Lignipirellula cremea]
MPPRNHRRAAVTTVWHTKASPIAERLFLQVERLTSRAARTLVHPAARVGLMLSLALAEGDYFCSVVSGFAAVLAAGLVVIGCGAL